MSPRVGLRPTDGSTRFAGAELQAAAALVSVLKTESDIGQARAAATLRAAGAGENHGPGVSLSAALGAQLPLPALFAAARSLREIGGTAARELDCLAAGEGAAAAAGEGGVRAGGGVGQPSAVRLARYLTRQADQ